MEKEEKPKGIIRKIFGAIVKIIVILALLAGVAFVLKIAPNYIRNEITDKTNLVLNFTDVTGRTKQDVLVEDNVVYISLEDIKNYYDKDIYYDEQYNHIVTSSDEKIAVLEVDQKKMLVNGVPKKINGSVKEKDGVYYLPISEMQEIYNIKAKIVGNKVIIESLDRKLTTAVASKKLDIKYKTTFFSKNIEKIEQGEKVAIAEVDENTLPEGWVKVRTQSGNLGYVEKKNLTDTKVEREDKIAEKFFDGKISMAWEYDIVPDNTGKKYDGVNVVSPYFFYLKLKNTDKENLTPEDVKEQAKIIDNVGNDGVEYIKWAKSNNYKVWARIANETNESTIDEFSCIINDYGLRQAMIYDIVGYAKEYELDGINIDFEYMYKDDKDSFSKFIIELAPLLKEINVCLSVDVTAPYGGANWSLCYDRNLIGEKADYIVFMGYDQYGTTAIGTTSGYNWLENSIKNFMNGENNVPVDKIILGLPFYAKLWRTKDGEVVGRTSVVYMNNMESSIPANSSKEWLEDLRQYYVQYDKDGYTYKLWVEDERSFAEKIGLVKKYDLAGAAYWRKGFDSEGVWKVIKKALDL